MSEHGKQISTEQDSEYYIIATYSSKIPGHKIENEPSRHWSPVWIVVDGKQVADTIAKILYEEFSGGKYKLEIQVGPVSNFEESDQLLIVDELERRCQYTTEPLQLSKEYTNWLPFKMTQRAIRLHKIHRLKNGEPLQSSPKALAGAEDNDKAKHKTNADLKKEGQTMDFTKFLTPRIAEIEKLLKSFGAAGKPLFQQHIESFLKTIPKTAVMGKPKKAGEPPETLYVAAFNWLSYPLSSNMDLLTDGRPPNDKEQLDLAFFRLAALYDGVHQRPGRDKICFDFLNPPPKDDDLAFDLAIGFWDESKRLVEQEGRQGEVEALLNQDLRLVENEYKDDDDEDDGLPSRPYDDIDNSDEFAHGLQHILYKRIVRVTNSSLAHNSKEDLIRQANAITNRIDQYRDKYGKEPQELGLTEIIAEISNHYNLFQTAIGLAQSKANVASEQKNAGTNTGQKSKLIEWDETNPDYMSASEAIATFTGSKLPVPTLSNMLKPDGLIRYMRKGRRCKVHIGDFRQWAEQKYPSDKARGEITDDYIAGVEARKKTIRKEP